jgi:acyl-ACP thioesterase
LRAVEATELVPAPPAGRVFTEDARVGLGDVAPSGRVRLDAVARMLQDAAFADVIDSGVLDDGVWVVRRLRLRVERFPRFEETVTVATWCSGTGPLWAERRSTVRGEQGGLVEAVALWVHLAPDGMRPCPLPEGFAPIYGAAAAGRRVRARLRHPSAAPGDASASTWRFRGADLDLAGHVNNAAYWEMLEEELAIAPDPPAPYDTEIEHRAPADVGDVTVLRAGPMRWIVDPDGTVLASLAVGSVP